MTLKVNLFLSSAGNIHEHYISMAGLHVLGKFSFLGKNFLILGRFFSG